MRNRLVALVVLLSLAIGIFLSAYLFLPNILSPTSILYSPDFEIDIPHLPLFSRWPISQGYYEASTLDVFFVKSINNFDSIVLLSGKVTPQAQVKICFTTLDLYGQSFGRIDASFQYPEVIGVIPPVNGNTSINIIVGVNEIVPIGNYTITITGISGEISHSITIPLEIRKSWGAGLAIQTQSIDWTVDSATIYVQNVGSDTVTLTEVYLDGNRVDSVEGLGQLIKGSTTTLTISGTFVNGQSVRIKVVCEEGSFSESDERIQF